MDLVQDFKRMAFCFAIMASAVAFVALSADAHDYAVQNHPARPYMAGAAGARYHQRHGDRPMPCMSVVAHRGLFVVSNLAGLVQ